MKGDTIRPIIIASAALLAAGVCVSARAQSKDPEPQPILTAKAAAPVDLTGYWVSVVNTDWRWRMLTPAKGDFNMMPLTPEAKQVGNDWDPARDEAAGQQCRAYGAAGLMRIPTRLHISWKDGNTLEVQTDAGKQIRLLHFGPLQSSPGTGQATWQGESAASWNNPATGASASDKDPSTVGSLHVVTTRMRAGYLRKNGVPYSANAVLTEDWDTMKEPDGTDWIVITTSVADPVYLQMPWMTSPVFERERNGSKWDPTPCAAK